MSLDQKSGHPQGEWREKVGGPVTLLGSGFCQENNDTQSLEEHLEIFGDLPKYRGLAVISLVRQSGLLGRGGAGFPAYRKMEAVAAQARSATVVVNGAESEPASFKDRTLLSARPHLVLDGAVMAARAIGAGEIVVYIHRGETVVRAALLEALGARLKANFEEPPILLVEADRAFVGGESTSVVSFINRAVAKPTFNQRNWQAGVGGRPTLVQNVETLAHLALVVYLGPASFRRAGSRGSPGSQLVTLTGGVRTPGKVVEIVHPAPLGQILGDEMTGTDPPQAILFGGYGGSFAEGSRALEFEYSREALTSHGLSLGCGLIGVLPQGTCGLGETARLMRYLASESAGQCGPCLYGLDGLASIMEDLVEFRVQRRTIRSVEARFSVVEGRGACAHPDAAVSLMRSALEVFSSEVAAHLNGRCLAHSKEEVFYVPKRRRG